MEFNKIAGAILVTLLSMMAIGKIGNTLVPIYHPPHEKEGAETAGPKEPEVKEPEKPVAELLAAADPKAGESRARACTSCHTFEKGGKNGVGPNLWDVVGRKRGSHAGFAYSDGLKNAGGEWTFEDIFKYLANPGGMIPGSKMAFRLPNAEQRAQVIAFLRTLSDQPKPLPAVEKKAEQPAPKPDEKKAEPAKPDEKKPEPAKTEEKKAEPPKPAEAPKAAEPPKADEKAPAPAQPATPPADEKKD